MPDAPSPDLFEDVFQWHPKYLPPMVLDDRLLLLCESALLVLGSPGVLALMQGLQRGESLATQCRKAGGGTQLAEMLHALGALQQQGLVHPTVQPTAEVYLLPDASAAPEHTVISRRIDAISLTVAVTSAVALHWGQSLACAFGSSICEAGLTIVYCDDYLDPRLEEIAARQRSAGRPWMLVKPTGEQAMAGPVFAAHANRPTACWHCMAHRWRRNHPAQAWWCAHRGDQGAWPPVRAGAELVATRLHGLLSLAGQLLAQPEIPQAVWTLGLHGRHPVAARPQCLYCGTPGLMARRQRERIAPVPGRFATDRDGGWRTVPPSDTVERLSHHVDPLTGVIARVMPLNAESCDVLTVYRSEIVRTPTPGGDSAPGAWTQVCLGKGMSAVQARASAMCEAIERHAAFYQGDEAVVVAPAAALDARSVPPAALALFSERQRSRLGGDKPPPNAADLPGPGKEPAWWVPAWSLTADARCYLPLGFCLAHAPTESQCHATWTSNGCAAGNTTEEAILQGFLELVERDAAAVWWYGRIPRPAIDLDGIDAEIRERLSNTWGPQWSYWMLDITHDFRLPVAAAVGRHRATGEWAIGFGCGFDRMRACERAMTEMGQLIAAGKSFAAQPGPARSPLQEPPAFLMPMDEAAAVSLQEPDASAPRDLAEAIARCVGIAAGLGLETIVFDYSRPDIPLCTVKVVVPGLCHIWPELGNPRLRTVPVALGWRDEPMQECDFNPQPLYV